ASAAPVDAGGPAAGGDDRVLEQPGAPPRVHPPVADHCEPYPRPVGAEHDRAPRRRGRERQVYSMTQLFEQRTFRSRILRRIAISLVVGAFGYFLTELTGQPEIVSLLLSVVFGGITLVVQSLMEFEHRLARVEAATTRHSSRVEDAVRTGFAKISDVTE